MKTKVYFIVERRVIQIMKLAFFEPRFYLALLLVVGIQDLFGQTPLIELGDGTFEYRVEKVLLMPDPEENISFDQIKAGRYDIDFKLVETNQPVSSDVSTYWLKLTLINTLDFDDDWVLDFNGWSYVDVYHQSGGTISEHHGGHLLPFGERDTPHGNQSLITVKVRSDTASLLWVRLQKGLDSELYIPIDYSFGIYDESTIEEKNRSIERVISIFLGIFIVMFLYHLVVYFTTKDKIYLYYLFLLGCLMYMSANNSGYIVSILSFSDGFPVMRMRFEAIVVSALGIAAMLFSRNFLNFKKRYPRWYRIFTVVIIWSMVLPILHLIHQEIGANLINLTSLFVVTSILIMGIRSLRAGYPAAEVFVLAFTFSIAGSFVLILSMLQILPLNTFNVVFAMPLGATIQMILFAVALGTTIREKEKTDKILLNVFPEDTADELKKTGHANARRYEQATIMFTDFVGFTGIAAEKDSDELVSELDECFQAFDRITYEHNLEKIKTIGDAYMCAGGIPTPNTTNAIDSVEAALKLQDFMSQWNQERREGGKTPWILRIGIHTGSITAGVVGERKFAYDIWGEAVNLARRMEEEGEGGKINISRATHDLVKASYRCERRGMIRAKNMGEVEMYFVRERTVVETDSDKHVSES